MPSYAVRLSFLLVTCVRIRRRRTCICTNSRPPEVARSRHRLEAPKAAGEQAVTLSEKAPTAGTKLLVENLALNVTQAEVLELFGARTVLSAELLTTPDGTSRGVAFVTYQLKADAEAAVKDLEPREDGAHREDHDRRAADGVHRRGVGWG